MSTKVTATLVDLFAKLFPAVEPLTPRFVSLFLTRYLRRWKTKGSILSYKTRVKRLGKLHYRIDVDIDVTEKQAEIALKRALKGTIERR
jgi:hypothetical protein